MASVQQVTFTITKIGKLGGEREVGLFCLIVSGFLKGMGAGKGECNLAQCQYLPEEPYLMWGELEVEVWMQLRGQH